MCKGCGIIKAKAVKAYSRNPRSSMTVYEAKTWRRPPALKKVKLLYWSSCWRNVKMNMFFATSWVSWSWVWRPRSNRYTQRFSTPLHPSPPAWVVNKSVNSYEENAKELNLLWTILWLQLLINHVPGRLFVYSPDLLLYSSWQIRYLYNYWMPISFSWELQVS